MKTEAKVETYAAVYVRRVEELPQDPVNKVRFAYQKLLPREPTWADVRDKTIELFSELANTSTRTWSRYRRDAGLSHLKDRTRGKAVAKPKKRVAKKH